MFSKRVVHLATYSKKIRIKKKNRHRIIKEMIKPMKVFNSNEYEEECDRYILLTEGIRRA